MSQFDKYFTNNDKPFAENINDALLVSNVFDYTVNIKMPTMFSDNSFIENYSPRKCGVAIVTLLSNDGLTINQDNIFGTGRLIFKIYPNFNSFGNIKSISWVAEGGINCSIEKSDGTVIVENVGNGTTLNNSNLKILQEYTVNLEFTEATLSSLTVTFENQESSNRYGANVKVQSVDGLSEQLNNMDTAITNNSTLIGEKVDKVTGKGLSVNDYTDADKNKVSNLKAVATTGDYTDLVNKPNIPSKTSDLTNDGADGTNAFVSNNDNRLTNARTPLSHNHNNITNDGKIGTVSGKLITTGTGGVLQAVDTITKSKISDFPSTMPPSSHTHTKSQITDFPTSMTPTSHTHGALSNTGTVNSDIILVNKVAVTDINNALKTINKLPFEKLDITKSNITGLGIPSTNTTYSVATANANGLMSSTDKSKLDGIATGATKNTIDTALSSTSTNAVQNKVINTALSGKANSSHTHTIANVTNLQNTLNGKANSSHTHTVTQVAGLNWQSVTLTNMSGVTLYYNDLFCRLLVAGSYKISTANSYTNMVTGTIPTDYRPTNARVELNTGAVLIRIKLTDDGHLQYYSPQTFDSNVGLYAEFIWGR